MGIFTHISVNEFLGKARFADRFAALFHARLLCGLAFTVLHLHCFLFASTSHNGTVSLTDFDNTQAKPTLTIETLLDSTLNFILGIIVRCPFIIN